MLLRIVGNILQKPCGTGHIRDPLLPTNEIVANASVTTCTSALMGHLLLVENTTDVDKMFTSVLRDLKLKITQSINTKSKKSRPSEIVIPDESLVNLIENMGFSCNGDKRAVMATHNESMESALSWAIHHSSEEGWDDPVTSAHAVCGALLPEEHFPSISLDDLNEAVKVVSRLSKAYNKAVGKSPLPVVIVPSDTECHSGQTDAPVASVGDTSPGQYSSKALKSFVLVNYQYVLLHQIHRSPRLLR